MTDATAVWPEHKAVPQSARFGVIVSELRRGAARTVTATVTCGGAGLNGPRSWTVTLTVVSASTLFARSRIFRPDTFCATGRTAGLDEEAWKNQWFRLL